MHPFQMAVRADFGAVFWVKYIDLLHCLPCSRWDEVRVHGLEDAAYAEGAAAGAEVGGQRQDGDGDSLQEKCQCGLAALHLGFNKGHCNFWKF